MPEHDSSRVGGRVHAVVRRYVSCEQNPRGLRAGSEPPSHDTAMTLYL